ncbi:MAG: translation initiation factor IF-2 [Saprospiraceae bacterium]|nr:translation initiation factor IF-2 [Saprospiraceae bacterium]MDW8229863.1 translation initiation factor IF-2 [Saprospiraceae bacterium]
MALKLIRVARDFNVGLHTIVETLRSKGFTDVEEKPTAEITDEMLSILEKEFQRDLAIKKEADKLARPAVKKELAGTPSAPSSAVETTPPPASARPSLLPPREPAAPPPATPTPPAPKEELPVPDVVKREKPALRIVGKVDLDTLNKPAEKATPEPLPPAAPPESTIAPAPEPEKPAAIERPPLVEKPTQPQQVPPAQAPATTTPAPKSETPSAPAETPAAVPTPSTDDKTADTELYRAESPQLRGLKIVGKVDLDKRKKEAATSDKNRNQRDRARPEKGANASAQSARPAQQGGTPPGAAADSSDKERRKRKRKKVQQQPITAETIQKTLSGNQGEKRGKGRASEPREVSKQEIEDQIKKTMTRLGAGASRKRQKIRREKRESIRERTEIAEAASDNSILQVTEFISVSDLASLMNVKPADVIKACMSLGVFVSINQRLDAEIIELIASEFGYKVNFISAEEQVEIAEDEEDKPEDLVPRQPIVTVMGHVDHGKTSLLDYIRKANVAAGEAGGITQHIGAYEVTVGEGTNTRKITFLDTPGHEAFTAMRARGAKVTDVAIIVIAADDSVMPQTKEAISHAQAAGVPIVFAINKIDKEGADPDRIRNELAQMNFLVEEWGGRYQCQEISAKKGTNIDKLLEKVLLEADLLDLKANPKRRAIGTVLEASLEKGRGYVAKVLIENGTLNEGDPIIAGEYSGKVKAMFNERGKRIKEAGPATPVLVLGLDGAPQAGEKLKETATEAQAREIATRRAQILREQANRASKRISLDEIGRRLALGNFKELKIIVKGDVDGSVEALSDALIKLSVEKIQVNVIHKAVGQIIDSDVMLASASDAIIIGFQVRPSATARKLAEREGVQIKLYSIIYEAIEEVKAAMEGMLEPTKEEEIVGQAEVREVFKISKVGTVAGCYVQEGKISRNHYVRVIRDGIVIYPVHEGQHVDITSLKRFKEDVKEVRSGLECGLTVRNFNDIKVGDIIEAYTIKEVKSTL